MSGLCHVIPAASTAFGRLFDPAFIVALVAIWYTWRQFRRANHVVLRVDACQYSEQQLMDENACQPFASFSVQVTNHGITLHSTRLGIVFFGPPGRGTISIPLTRYGSSSIGNDRFERGMMGEFGLKSYEIRPEDRAFILLLGDIDRQEASLCVSSQGFLATEFKLGGYRESLKEGWNRFAAWSNGWFDRRVGTNAEEMPVIRVRRVLPQFVLKRIHLRDFIRRLSDSDSADAKIGKDKL